MTIKYNYKCFSCEATYLEQRAVEETQFFTTCQACGIGTYQEVSVEIILETVERVAAPVEEPTND